MEYREIERRLPQIYKLGGGLVTALVNALEMQNLLPHQLSPLDLKGSIVLSEQLVASENRAWRSFLGKDTIVPTPPQELSVAMLKAKEIGWTQAEAHFFPKIEFEQDSNFPGWTVKPEEWYWQQIKTGTVAKDAATLEEGWIIIDGSQKPQYKDGKQMYENDPFTLLLTQLRKEGKIQVPDWCRDIPKASRFGVSDDELRGSVNPANANLLGVQPEEQVRVPKEIEFNVLGNLYHPEWGKTNTWEWLEDKFEDGNRLIGGNSDSGGLARVNGHASDNRDNFLGFRPLVVFSPRRI